MGNADATGDRKLARAQVRAAQRGIMRIQALANLAGAGIVAAYVRLVAPSVSAVGTEPGDINLPVILIYVLVSIAVTVPVEAWLLRRSLRWIEERREPTPRERWAVLSTPIRLTFTAFIVWVGGALLFGLLLLRDDPNQLPVTVAIAVGGLITCSLQELLLDRQLRPVFALVLDRARLPRWRREILTRVMVGWWLGSAVPLLAIGLAPLVIPADQLSASDATARVIVLVLTAVGAGGLVMRGAAGAVSAPLNSVTDALARIEDGDLDVHVAVTHIGEIGRLQQGVNDMVAGLRDRERIRDLFGRQVGLDVGDVSDDGLPRLGGEAREITALFVDIDDFTSYAEGHSPAQVVDELNAFYAVVIRVVMAEGGWVNKFEGDAALCIFGAPAVHADHASRALRAAAALPGELAATPQRFRVGIGVATGEVAAGNVGTPERHEFTVIGDAVNVAARLTELAKRDHRTVLASQETLVAAGETHPSWHEVGTVVLRGRTLPTRLFQPTALASPVASADGNP